MDATHQPIMTRLFGSSLNTRRTSRASLRAQIVEPAFLCSSNFELSIYPWAPAQTPRYTRSAPRWEQTNFPVLPPVTHSTRFGPQVPTNGPSKIPGLMNACSIPQHPLKGRLCGPKSSNGIVHPISPSLERTRQLPTCKQRYWYLLDIN